jgi:hypothetical protein
LDAAENLLDLAATAAAVQVHGDDEGRHLCNMSITLMMKNQL